MFIDYDQMRNDWEHLSKVSRAHDFFHEYMWHQYKKTEKPEVWIKPSKDICDTALVSECLILHIISARGFEDYIQRIEKFRALIPHIDFLNNLKLQKKIDDKQLDELMLSIALAVNSKEESIGIATLKPKL